MKNRYNRNAFNSLSTEQRIFIQENLNKMKRADIADAINVPVSRLKRAASFAGWKFTFTKGFADLKYDPTLVVEVLNYFDSNGKIKTQEKFPDINIRSVVERYGKGRNTRCKKWSNNDLIELMKMGGIISFENQAIFFNRPRAHKGSIVSVWQKVFGVSSRCMNGLPKYKAEKIAKKECPYIKSEYKNGMKLYLWCDLKNYLLPNCSEVVKRCINIMCEFQERIFNGEVKEEIKKMQKERRYI